MNAVLGGKRFSGYESLSPRSMSGVVSNSINAIFLNFVGYSVIFYSSCPEEILWTMYWNEEPIRDLSDIFVSSCQCHML